MESYRLRPNHLEIRFYALKDWKSRLLSLLGGTRFNHVDLRVGDLVLGIYHPGKVRLDLVETIARVITPEVVIHCDLPQGKSLSDLYVCWNKLNRLGDPRWFRLFTKRWTGYPKENTVNCSSLLLWSLNSLYRGFGLPIKALPLWTPDEIYRQLKARIEERGYSHCIQRLR